MPRSDLEYCSPVSEGLVYILLRHRLAKFPGAHERLDDQFRSSPRRSLQIDYWKPWQPTYHDDALIPLE
jgi:hypothetical protein